MRDARIPDGLDGKESELLHWDMRTFMQSQKVPDGLAPMIRITRYLPPPQRGIGGDMTNGPTDQAAEKTGESGGTRAYIAIAINHLVADGVGASRIAQALLADNVDHLVPDIDAGHPPRLEYTVDLSAAPIDTDVTASPRPVWPSTATRGPTIDYPQGLSLLFLPSALVDKIKLAARGRGVDKLHATLKTAWAIAMASVLGRHSAAGSEEKDWDWTVSTPRSERLAGVHPYATGDYVSRIISRFCSSQLAAVSPLQSTHFTKPGIVTFGSVAKSPFSQEAYWDLARLVYTQLSDPIEQQNGRHAMSLPALLPNPPNNPGHLTAWEEHYLAQSRSPAPLATSAILSNLTYIPLPSKATGMSWAQPACPFSAAIMTSIVGSEAGLSWASTWREGCVLDERDVKAVERAFVGILHDISN